MDEIKQALKEEGFSGMENPIKKQLISKHSLCPICNTSLDGGDVYTELAKLGINTNKTSKEIEEMASKFGWTPTTKMRFSKLSIQEVNGIALYKCPNIRCGAIFGGKDLFAYESIQDALKNIPLLDNPKDIQKYFEGVRDIDNIDLGYIKFVVGDVFKTSISDMNNEEIMILINMLIAAYRENNNPETRRKIKRDYLELAAWYNEESGIELFKMSL